MRSSPDIYFLQYGLLLFAFLLTAGCVTLSLKPARRLGWVDRPCTRKHHASPVPLTGGIAMCAAYCLSLPLLPDKPPAWPVLSACLILLTLVGFYDDLYSSRPVTRFLFHIIAVLLMTFGGGVVLNDMGNLFGGGHIALGNAAVLFTLFGVVGVINAFNMIDGLDGLAGGVALIATGWLIVLNLLAPVPDSHLQSLLLLLAMVIAGFLCFNLRHPWRTRASVFMGDAGSTMLGFALSWFMVDLSQDTKTREAVMMPMTAVWILALPLLDTVTVMVRRIVAGQSPFAADRQHLHHLLLSQGLSDGRVTAILLAGTVITGAMGGVAYWLKVPEYVQLYAFLAGFCLYYRVTTTLWKRYQNRALET